MTDARRRPVQPRSSRVDGELVRDLARDCVRLEIEEGLDGPAHDWRRTSSRSAAARPDRRTDCCYLDGAIVDFGKPLKVASAPDGDAADRLRRHRLGARAGPRRRRAAAGGGLRRGRADAAADDPADAHLHQGHRRRHRRRHRARARAAGRRRRRRAALRRRAAAQPERPGVPARAGPAGPGRAVVHRPHAALPRRGTRRQRHRRSPWSRATSCSASGSAPTSPHQRSEVVVTGYDADPASEVIDERAGATRSRPRPPAAAPARDARQRPLGPAPAPGPRGGADRRRGPGLGEGGDAAPGPRRSSPSRASPRARRTWSSAAG